MPEVPTAHFPFINNNNNSSVHVFMWTHHVLSSNFFFFVCQLSSISLTHQLPTDPENVAALKPSSVVGREFFSCNQAVSINPPVVPAFMLSNCRICSVHEAGDVSALDPLPSSDLLDHFHPFSFYFVISLSFISVCDFAPLLCYWCRFKIQSN